MKNNAMQYLKSVYMCILEDIELRGTVSIFVVILLGLKGPEHF